MAEIWSPVKSKMISHIILQLPFVITWELFALCIIQYNGVSIICDGHFLQHDGFHSLIPE